MMYRDRVHVNPLDTALHVDLKVSSQSNARPTWRCINFVKYKILSGLECFLGGTRKV